MKTVPAREANQAFSRLLREAAAGEEIVITRWGEPVAKLVAFNADTQVEKRKRAAERLIRRLNKGVDLGGLRVNRDQLYDR